MKRSLLAVAIMALLLPVAWAQSDMGDGLTGEEPISTLKLTIGKPESLWRPYYRQPGLDWRNERQESWLGRESISAWVVGAQYSMSAGSFMLGYGQHAPDGMYRLRQMSIGYAYPLTKHSWFYADASQQKADQSQRYYSIGVRASY